MQVSTKCGLIGSLCYLGPTKSGSGIKALLMHGPEKSKTWLAAEDVQITLDPRRCLDGQTYYDMYGKISQTAKEGSKGVKPRKKGRCPECRAKVSGNADRCCKPCHEKRKRAIRR